MRHYILLAAFVLCAAYLVIPTLAQTGASQAIGAEPPVYKVKEVDQRIAISLKPEPGYTTEARKNDVTGTVSLRCIFHSSGTVTNITVLKELPDGLTEKAIAAAKQIKFTPAMKDGRPVSMYAVVNYSFEIYDREDDPEVTRKAVILEQPAATYTDEAKVQRIEGKVILLVSLARDGRAHVIEVVSGLPHGLTEQAKAAVKGIKFTPAEKSGVPTTVGREITYEFKLD